jgi:Tfp pilus assembly protein PilF
MRILLLIITFLTFFSCNKSNDDSKKIVYLDNQHDIINFNYKFKNSIASELNSLALKKVEENNNFEAKKLFEKAYKIENDNVVLINNLALVNVRLNQKNNVEELYKKAFLVDSNYIGSYINYGDFLNIHSRFDEANKILLKGLDKNPTNQQKTSLYFNLSLIMGKQKQYEFALEYAHYALDNSQNENQKKEINYLIEFIKRKMQK